jgi:hypothetical protein
MTPVGGGVHVEAEMALDTSNRLPDDGAKVQKARDGVSLDDLAEGQWWWD